MIHSLSPTWDAGVPRDGDVAVFPIDAEITTLGAAVTVDELKFAGDATLTLKEVYFIGAAFIIILIGIIFYVPSHRFPQGLQVAN